ncbi:hypothetical protein NZK32_00635 [Cyanobium sp. FGCU-52]|nr:hypothetical protein [Cyanobium sp. FGCU52]
MERTLVVILAETRAYEFSFASFKSNLLDSLGADLALCIANNEWEHQGNPYYQAAKYIWTYEEPRDWGTAFDLAQKVEGWHGDWRCLLQLNGILMGGVHDHSGCRTKGSGSILLFFRWLLKQKLIETGVYKQYDRFVITRSDYIHTVHHFPLRLMNCDHIWIPDGEDYGGYTDRHIVVSQKDVLAVLSVTDPILRDPEGLYHRLCSRREWNLERYLKYAFCELGIDACVRRYPFTMYAVRSADGRTSWSTGTFSMRHGYCIKYRDEHRKALLASKMILRPEDWTPEATAAFCKLVSFTDWLQHCTSLWVHPIKNVRLRRFCCMLIYGSFLSDRWFASVYSRLCVVWAQFLTFSNHRGGAGGGIAV